MAEGKAAVIGGISGAISFGIGESVTGMTNFVAKAGLQAGMHGIKSGLMTSIEGGAFMSGFAAGAVSSLVSSSVEGLGHSGGYYIDDDYTQWSSFGARNPNLLKAMMISSGGFSGGISSSIAGGNFWSGAREGLITSGLNHVAHMMLDNGGDDKEKKLFQRTDDDYGDNFYDRATNPEFWKDLGKKFLFGDDDPNLIKADIGDNLASSFISGAGAVKGLNWLAKMAKKPNFVSSNIRKIGDYFELSVKNSGSNGTYTIYRKFINSNGKTIKIFHDTYDKTGKFLHREFMNGQERVKIWWNGSREWFSKWR
ncbi:MAG: hypothetical protein ACK4UK_08200 [Flavobacterium sp.]